MNKTAVIRPIPPLDHGKPDLIVSLDEDGYIINQFTFDPHWIEKRKGVPQPPPPKNISNN